MRTTQRLLALGTLALGVLASASAQAGDWNLLVNGKAIHVNASRDWNENNLGIGIEREFEAGSRWITLAMANGYRDSDENMAYMAGGGVKRRFDLGAIAPQWHVDLGVIGFLMTREDVDNNRRFPGALPVMTVGNGDMAINMTYFPTSLVKDTIPIAIHDDTVDGVLFLQFSFDMGLFDIGRRRGALFAASE